MIINWFRSSLGGTYVTAGLGKDDHRVISLPPCGLVLLSGDEILKNFLRRHGQPEANKLKRENKKSFGETWITKNSFEQKRSSEKDHQMTFLKA